MDTFPLILVNRMESVLVSRFLLDLQEAHQRSAMLDSRHMISTGSSAVDEGSISFARISGPFSATIDRGLSTDDYDIQSTLDTKEDEDVLVIGGPKADDMYWYSGKV